MRRCRGSTRAYVITAGLLAALAAIVTFVAVSRIGAELTYFFSKITYPTTYHIDPNADAIKDEIWLQSMTSPFFRDGCYSDDEVVCSEAVCLLDGPDGYEEADTAWRRFLFIFIGAGLIIRPKAKRPTVPSRDETRLPL